MAFPTGYSKYQEVTIDYTKVAADQTDFVVYINLADLLKGGADIFDTCRTDGGDIRATKSDGTTELPIEIVAIDTTAKTGEIHVKYSGTLSSSSNTIIRIYYNGSDTLPSVSSTYGRNNVWTGYSQVYHLGQDPSTGAPQFTDSTASGFNLTTTGSMTSADVVAGQLGNGIDFDRSNDRATYTGGNLGAKAAFTIQAWVKPNQAGARAFIAANTDGTGFSTDSVGLDTNNATSGNVELRLSTTSAAGGFSSLAAPTGTLPSGVWRKIDATRDGAQARIYSQGSQVATSSSFVTAVSNNLAMFGLGSLGTFAGVYFGGVIDEYRFKESAISASWVTTEYNNQNSSSTFYSTGNEQGGSTNVTVTPAAQVATFSVPTRSVKVGIRKFPAAQSAVFSTPSRVVSIRKTVTPAVQTAVFSTPSRTISVGGNVTKAVGVQVLTFSVPARVVSLPKLVLPAVQVAVFSTPTPVISIVSNKIVLPLTQVLSFSIPTIAKAGGVWTKRPRATNATWSKRSVNSN